MSDPTSSIVSQDTLLLKKERQLQRRLSGRRLFQDFGVFALLLPVGLTVLVRGVVAMVQQARPP